MTTLVFFLEEPSAKEMLKGILPRVLDHGVDVRYLVFQGKQDLERNLMKKLRGWRMPDTVFVVMRDQDSGDCKRIKDRLASLCTESGKENVLIRIACRELESFYLGDLAAVEQGLGLTGLKKMQQGKKFRNPDALAGPSGELDRLTRHVYDKVSGSRAIAPFLDIEQNRSHSFRVLVSGIRNRVASLS